MNIDLIYSIAGVIGGLIMCISDILLDLKGKDNKKIGHIDSNWKKMSTWRFHWSIILSAIGVPMAGLGFYSLSHQIEKFNLILSFVFKVLGHIGSVGGFFVHTALCYAPCIYKSLEDKKTAEKVLNSFFNAAKIPFYFFALILNFGTSGAVAYALIKNYIHLSKFFILLTPYFTLMFGMILRKVKYSWFYDLPGIIMPSFGIGCIGLIGILNILLN